MLKGKVEFCVNRIQRPFAFTSLRETRGRWYRVYNWRL